jgi:transcriptional regulator with XRE-family HTH domain
MSSEPRLDNPLKVKKIAYMKVIGEKILWARERREMTQDDLAHDLGYRTRNAVSNWERGKNMPAAAKMNPLAKRLGVDHDWLFNADHISLADAIKELGDQVPEKPAAIRIAGTPAKAFRIVSAEAVYLSDPQGVGLQLTDPAGGNMSFPVDRTTLDLLQSALDKLKQYL